MEKAENTKLTLPDKLYFRIGEVSSLTGLEAYVLRFWETEFKGINPKRTESGQRLYRKEDVELIYQIKHLLHEKKFTIRGAKQYLSAKRKEKKEKSTSITFEEITSELYIMKEILNS
ncbi:MAG: MerR family transcriptional regulator [Pseudomonadota bacterium]